MDESKKKALQLGARFTLPPNSLGYCGKDSAPEKFKNCFIKEKCDNVEQEFTHFIVLHPYLKTISQITNKPKFSYQVVESYWLGNKLLEKAKVSDYQILMENFLEQGVPPWFVEELKEKIPNKFIPFHLFQVLHIGVGKASGSVPFDLESINNCMIRWGEIVSIDDNELLIKINLLEKKNKRYELRKQEEKFPYQKEFFNNLKKGQTIAVHWQQPIKILTKKEKENLSYWTKETLDSLKEEKK